MTNDTVTGFASDARKEDEVVALVEQIESTIGPIEVLVFNIGANVPSSILDETARKYFKIWEMACLGGFLNGREVAKRMVARDGEGHKGAEEDQPEGRHPPAEAEIGDGESREVDLRPLRHELRQPETHGFEITLLGAD